MRKQFAAWMAAHGAARQDTVFLTGDLGFMALETVREAMGDRFLNAGVAEQNMVSTAAGLAQQGLAPFCYSIAPFIAFRPLEQIRLDVCIHNQNVKLVGNGGGYGYGIMGASHHALEDLAVLSAQPNLRCFIPFCNEDVAPVCDAMAARPGPAYLRLGFGAAPAGLNLASPYAPVRQLTHGGKMTVVGLGPVLLNAFQACQQAQVAAEVFAVAEFPVTDWGPALAASLRRTGRLLIIEEHAARGGLGEHLALWMLQHGLSATLEHRYALGYPQNRYGSQNYHQRASGLDIASLQDTLRRLSHD